MNTAQLFETVQPREKEESKDNNRLKFVSASPQESEKIGLQEINPC